MMPVPLLADFVAKRFLGIRRNRCSGCAPKLIPISFVAKIAIPRKGPTQTEILSGNATSHIAMWANRVLQQNRPEADVAMRKA
jgi:hypothetical protein